MESSSITLQSYGMDITDKGIFISAELIYGDHLRLPLKLLIETTFHDSTLTIAPSRIYLGKIRLPIEKYPFSRLAEKSGMDPNSILNSFKYDIVLSDWSLLPTITDIYFRDNRMVLVYKLDESLLFNSVNTFSNNIDWYAGEFNDCIEVLREYHDEGVLGERFTKLIEKFSSDPGSFSGFISESLAISSKSASKEYLDEKGPWFVRFMPEINQKKISDMHDALYNLCAERTTLFSSLMDKLQTSYNSNKLKIDERGFIYNDKPFNLENYLGANWDKYSAWLDASSFRPVLIGALNAYALKTPILKKITGSMDFVDKAADSNGKYPIGFIVKMKDGTPILKYYGTTVRNDESTEVVNRTVILDKAKYESMKNNPLVPVWID